MIYVAKVENGNVVLYDAESGNRKRTFSSMNGDPVSATVQGDIVSVTTSRGKVDIFDTNGNYQRSI
jgi:hypothetical protein